MHRNVSGEGHSLKEGKRYKLPNELAKRLVNSGYAERDDEEDIVQDIEMAKKSKAKQKGQAANKERKQTEEKKQVKRTPKKK